MNDKKIVLVVDDDAEMRCLLSDFLTSRGYQVLTAPSARLALEKIGNNPDLVISDIHMQPLNGLALLEKLKTLRPGLPVILISAFAERDCERELKGQGARRFLPKPFRLSEIESAVKAELGLRSAA